VKIYEYDNNEDVYRMVTQQRQKMIREQVAVNMLRVCVVYNIMLTSCITTAVN